MKSLFKYGLCCLSINTLGGLMASCQSRHMSILKRNNYETKTLSNEKEQTELTIQRPIYQAATKQLIGVMQPDDVLCVIVSPENFKNLDLDFDSFIVALHEGEKGKICFMMKEVMKDLSPILQQYYRQNSCDISVIEVDDPFDFNVLSEKTGVGAGTSKSNWEGRSEKIGTYQDFYNCINYASGWITLNKEKIQSASGQIPPQVEDWSCGSNSAARALILAGRSISQYDSFLWNCPKSNEIARENSKVVCKSGFGTFVGGALLCLVPGALPVALPIAGAGWLTLAGGAVAQTVAEHRAIGPSPHYLSEYINQHLPYNRYSKSAVFSYDSFGSCASSIIQDIKDGDPVIAFFLYQPTTWHYANVVATQGHGDKFMILNTNSNFESLNYHDMEDLMRNDYGFNTFFGCKGHIGNYNIIRFYRK